MVCFFRVLLRDVIDYVSGMYWDAILYCAWFWVIDFNLGYIKVFCVMWYELWSNLIVRIYKIYLNNRYNSTEDRPNKFTLRT